jgi:hypothetical protein
MGKDLHYSIRPFIEAALNAHSAVEEIQSIELDNFYAYKVIRRGGMSSVIVVLSDDYYFGSSSLYNKPEILKDGGFFLIARPEASGIDKNEPHEKLGVGKLGKLLGALNREDYWNYFQSIDKKDRRK